MSASERPSEVHSLHFDFSGLPAETGLTYHLGMRDYPILPHTEETRNAARESNRFLRLLLPSAITLRAAVDAAADAVALGFSTRDVDVDGIRTTQVLSMAIKMPRAKEIGAWVTDVAAQTLAARAELVQVVERSSHRMDAAQQTTGPELQAAIEEAERRRQMTEQPTDMGAGGAAKPVSSGGSSQTPRSSPNAFVPPQQITAPYQTPRTGPQPFVPYQQGENTQLSTVNTSHGFSQPPPAGRVSRVSLALGLIPASGPASRPPATSPSPGRRTH
jgi:hypothetical protein